jgi:pseudouridine synthase
MPRERIQKLLSDVGVASRRQAEELVLQGRVAVNGRVVVSLPCFVDAGADEVRVDGEIVRLRASRQQYVLLNKPAGVTCAFRPARRGPGAGGAQDEKASIFDMLPPGRPPLLCTTPLNTSDAGLVLLTSDGQLAQELRHPRYRLEKTYYVEVEGPVSPAALEALKRGVKFGRWRTEGATVKVLRRQTDRTVLEVRIAEAKSGELRRILATAGQKARRLRRIAVGPLGDRGVKVGTWRRLSPGEVDSLRKAIWRR